MYKYLNSLSKEKRFIAHGGKRLKKKSKNEFTIITVVKNSETTIDRTIQSVLRQKKVKVEYIIIDGNSNDNTLGIIKKNQRKIDYWCTIKDKGIYDAMNYGLKLAKSKYICIINSDDIFYNDFSLHKIKKYFNKNKIIDYMFGTVKRHYLKNNLILKTGFNKKRFMYNFDSQTSHSTGFFIKNRVQKRIGLYDLNFKCSSDYDLFFRLFSDNRIIGGFTKKNEIIGEVSSGGYSSKYGFWNHLFEESKIRIKNKQNKFIILIIFFIAIIKHYIRKIFL